MSAKGCSGINRCCEEIFHPLARAGLVLAEDVGALNGSPFLIWKLAL